MRTMYIDCRAGVSGDMLMSALAELLPDPLNFMKTIHDLRIPNVSVKAEKTFRHGSEGTCTRVIWNGLEEDRNARSGTETAFTEEVKKKFVSPMKIDRLLASLPLSYNIIKTAMAVLHLIFEAESQVHGTDIKEIHNSRLGTMDAVIDTLGCCILINELNPERILASPVRTGYGKIHCSREILPVPAPATAYLLQDIPFYSGDREGEFCTPTGAALIGYFVNAYGPMPDMAELKSGCGIGAKDFGVSGGLKVFYGNV